MCPTHTSLFFFPFACNYVWMCMCISVCLLSSQVGHDSRSTDPEQPSQDVFLPLADCLSQPGQKESQPGVRMPPPAPSLTRKLHFISQSIQKCKSGYCLLLYLFFFFFFKLKVSARTAANYK